MRTSDMERKRKSRAKMLSEGSVEITVKVKKEALEKIDVMARDIGVTRAEIFKRLFNKVHPNLA